MVGRKAKPDGPMPSLKKRAGHLREENSFREKDHPEGEKIDEFRGGVQPSIP